MSSDLCGEETGGGSLDYNGTWGRGRGASFGTVYVARYGGDLATHNARKSVWCPEYNSTPWLRVMSRVEWQMFRIKGCRNIDYTVMTRTGAQEFGTSF